MARKFEKKSNWKRLFEIRKKEAQETGLSKYNLKIVQEKHRIKIR